MLEFINAGLIGYGYAGKTIHAPLLASIPGMKLHTIVSRDGAKVKTDWPHVHHVSTSDELLANPEIDLVVIATPNETHFPLAKAALQAGKHVVIDKPFTLDNREARQLIALAHQQDLQLSVFHNRRWDADFLTLRQVLESGELGDVLYLESHIDRYRPEVRDRWREQSVPGSGLWYDLGAHLLDQSLQLFGKPDNIWLDLAQQRQGARTDDYFHAVLQYGQRRMVLHASTQVVQSGPRFIVHGNRGSWIKYGLDTQEVQLKNGMTPEQPGFGLDPRPGLLSTSLSDDKLRQQGIPNQTGCYRHYYQHMLEAIQRGTPVPVKAEEAADVMELIELGLRSAREGRRLSLGQPPLDQMIHKPRPTAPTPLPPQSRPSPARMATPPQPTGAQSLGTPAPMATPVSRSLDPSPSTFRTTQPQSTPVSSPPINTNPPLSTNPQPLANPASASQPVLAPTQPNIAAPVPSRVQASLSSRNSEPLRSTPEKSERRSEDTAHSESPQATAFRAMNNPFRNPSPLDRGRVPAQAEPAPLPSRTTSEPASGPLQSMPPTTVRPTRSASLIGPIAAEDPEAAPDVLLPELSPASLIASERDARKAGLPLPRLSVDDGEENDDDALPPFSAS